jgi:hypothetical protein
VSVAVVEGWVEGPLKQFVDDARVLLALLLHPSGQVLGQHGFTRAVDVMSACALAAGIFASGGELGRMLEDRPFRIWLPRLCLWCWRWDGGGDWIGNGNRRRWWWWIWRRRLRLRLGLWRIP